MTNERLVEIAEEVVRLIRARGSSIDFLCLIPRFHSLCMEFESTYWKDIIYKYKKVAKLKYSGDYWIGSDCFWHTEAAKLDGKLDELMQVKADFLIEAIYQETGHRKNETKQ